MPSYFNQVLNPNMFLTASMRETIEDIRTAFLSCSFVRTVQSGSVDNISTLNPPTGTPSLTIPITYDVFAFNDSWQSTNPLFIKVRYFPLGTSNLYLMSLGIQMGTAHNNSGSFTGVDTTTELSYFSNSVPSPTSGSTIHAWGDGGAIAFTMFPQNAMGTFFVSERLYDINGQPTGSGFHMVGITNTLGSKTIYSQTAFYGQAPAPQESTYIPNSRPSRVPSLYDGRYIAGLVYPFYGRPLNPSPNILVGNSTDLATNLQRIKYTVYGTERGYINAGSFLAGSTTINSNVRFLLRIE